MPLETWLCRDTSRNRRVRSDEVEFMIWFTYNILQGAGENIGSLTTGGKTYEVWRKDSCGDGWEYIAFRPTSANDSGTISIE
jgi:hypothetical protein